MAEIRNFEGECSACGKRCNLFALDDDEDGYCEDCLGNVEE